MKIMLSAALVLAAFVAPATAESKYDRKIEEAAINIVVKKLGALRGGFSFDADPDRIMLPDFGSTASIPVQTRADGLAIAVERTPVSITF